ncbi:MAG: hypothetical protein AAGB19_18895 [Cyanobacteria bacterium P01_F01_bin.3]
MISRIIAGAAFALFTISSNATAPESKMPDLGEPAMPIVTAERATVSPKDGNTILQLTDVHPLVIVTAALDKDRCFDAFPIADFASSYNSCNVLKEHNDLWHLDGANSLLAFGSRSSASEHAGFRQNSPLITAPRADDATRTTTGEQGTAPLFVETAEYDTAIGAMSFVLADLPLASGNYEKVVLSLECATNSLMACTWCR